MRTLFIGSAGPSVYLLQLALVRAGFTTAVDGRFGEETRRAVISFQNARGLTPDGIVGPGTHRYLMPYYTGYIRYTVQRGDTLYSIAEKYGSSLDAVRLANFSPSVIYPGQVLNVPLPFSVVPTDIPYFARLVEYCVRGLSVRYPFLRSGSIGKSVMGKALSTLSFGSGGNRVIYNAAHHANEWITTPLLLKFCEDFCKAYAEDGSIYDQRAKTLYDYASVTLVPCVDPDGMDLVTGEMTDGAYFERAQAIAADYPQIPFPNGWKANINGVDLNLQYPADWDRARDYKYSIGFTSPAPSDFVGYAPLSQPEARAMYSFTRSLSPALTLSFHTQGEVIYWRYQGSAPLGSEQIAGLFSALSGYAKDDVPYGSSFAGYRDWFIKYYGRPGFTVEAGIGVNPLPIDQFDSIYRACLPIMVYGGLVT